MTDPLPGPEETEVNPEILVEQALGARLDLRAIATAIEASEARVRLERRKAWGDVAAGPAFQNNGGSNGGDIAGPGLSLTLPIFDQNQAQVARASLTPSSVSVSPDISGISQSTVAKVEANGDVSPFSLFGFGDSSKTTATGATSGVNGEQEAASRKSVKSQEMPGPFLKS